jgi:hypothetical protein
VPIESMPTTGMPKSKSSYLLNLKLLEGHIKEVTDIFNEPTTFDRHFIFLIQLA